MGYEENVDGIESRLDVTSRIYALLMTSLSLTQKWLKQNVGQYPDQDRVYLDVDTVLASYPTLRPKSDVYS